MKGRETSPDYAFFGVVVVLVVLGVLAVFDASFARAAQSKLAGYDSWYFAKRQLAFALLGMFAMFAVMHIPLDVFRKHANLLLYVSVILLAALFIPGVGKGAKGAVRWIAFGPFNFQPSELAKIAVVLYLAKEFDRQKNRVRFFRSGVLRHLVWIAVIAGLIMAEPDMGTTMVMVGAAFIMLFTAGAATGHLAGLMGLGIVGIATLIRLEPYRMARFTTFLDPWKDYYGAGYQIIHSLIALGTGGWHGVGLCEGREKMYIPEPHTDMIFPTIGEEAGLIGALAVMALFAFLTYKGISIGYRSKSTYAGLLATGVTSIIGLQAIINIAVVTSSIPATGVPLPFISYGGSSLLFMLIGVGIVLSVSRQSNMVIEENENEDSSNRRGNRRTHISSSQRRRSVPRKETGRKTAVYR